MGTVVLKNIEKSYDGKKACSEINLSIKEGEFFTFLGPSGCGKTTLLRLIAGFIKPEEGSVFLGGRDITNVAPEKREVGMVFQNYALFPFMTVYENVAYGLQIKKHSKAEIEQKVKKYIAMVKLDGFENRNVSELSGGEQQRVALARSLVVEPKVLLMDEPLSNLDARLRDTMRIEIKKIIKKLGITTIFVTHDQVEALAMSDRMAVFEKGKCVQIGTPREIYAYPNHSFVAGFIGETNLLKASIVEDEARITNMIRLNLAKSSEGIFVSIRPQDIKIVDKTKGQKNTFEGMVEEVQLSGMMIEYSIRVDDVLFKVTELNTVAHKNEVKKGQFVYLYMDPNGIHTLQA